MQPSTGFTSKVREVVAQIPKGKVATYGQVAFMAGNPLAPRAVGMIMSRNKDGNAVPCHRVVAASGALTGYGLGGISIKKQKLLAEGVAFKGSRVDMSKSQWRP